LEALGINLGYLLVQILNFAILFIVLRAWVYKPILNLLDTRRKAIADGLENARVAAEARQNAEQEAHKILTDSQAKANQIIREATERAEQQAREVTVQAEADVAQKRDAALVEVQQERERILGELRGQVAALAMAAAQRIIVSSLDQQRQRALIDEFFSGVRAGKVVVLEVDQITSSSAEVTSALPLTDNERETVRQDLLSKVGGQATVTFRVDPNILGGLVVRVGDKVLDGSIAGQLENLRQRLV
jgi:F-type H+-transporting ATPase subunit b